MQQKAFVLLLNDYKFKSGHHHSHLCLEAKQARLTMLSGRERMECCLDPTSHRRRQNEKNTF